MRFIETEGEFDVFILAFCKYKDVKTPGRIER